MIHSISELDYDYVTFPLNGKGKKREISFDLGQLTIDDTLILHLYGNPGAYTPFGVLQIEKPVCAGLVVMVDSRLPGLFGIARYIIAMIEASSPYPFIVAANRQDHPDAWSSEDLRYVLRVPDEVPVIPCVATDKESAKQVLLTLLYHVRDMLDSDDS